MEYTTCKYCNIKGAGNYCCRCGEAYHHQRITLKHMLHEAMHLITHFDKGFTYTLKRLVFNPGTMQRDYIAGARKNYQKPFPMFFLCGTVTALLIYWINIAVGNLYIVKNAEETHFFQHYFVLLQMALVPLYALVNRLIYFRARYNYAEFLVLILYNVSILFLFTVLSNALKLIFGAFETGYVEIVAILGYTLITNINFFNSDNRLMIVFKSIFSSTICFALARTAQLIFIGMVIK